MTVLLQRKYEMWNSTHLYFIADIDKFAIRPTIRNNEQLNRDSIIKIVADAVGRLGSGHSVDLTNYHCLILVEVYRVGCLSTGHG